MLGFSPNNKQNQNLFTRVIDARTLLPGRLRPIKTSAARIWSCPSRWRSLPLRCAPGSAMPVVGQPSQSGNRYEIVSDPETTRFWCAPTRPTSGSQPR